MADDDIDMLWMMRGKLHNGELMPQLRDFARAAMTAERGRCAREIDCACPERSEVLAALEHGGRNSAQRECRAGYCCAMMAADIRALKDGE